MQFIQVNVFGQCVAGLSATHLTFRVEMHVEMCVGIREYRSDGFVQNTQTVIITHTATPLINTNIKRCKQIYKFSAFSIPGYTAKNYNSKIILYCPNMQVHVEK